MCIRDRAITAAHNAEQPRRLSVPLPDGAPATGWEDALSGAAVPVVDGRLALELPAMSGAVLLAGS